MATNFNLLKIGQYHATLEYGDCDDATILIGNVDGQDIKIRLADLATYVASNKGIDQLNDLIGSYEKMPDITLTALESGKVINASGVKVAKSGWAIAEFTAKLGNVYLFNPGATASDVCVFAEKIDKVETRGIDYAYTYDAKGNPLTAKATYNGVTHSYTYTNTYTTQDGNETLSVVITDNQSGKTVEYLPQTFQTTVGAYQPMVRLNENAELPKDGYCRFVSNFQTSDSIRIAVSYKVDSANMAMKVVRSGMVASMCTQLSKINQKVDELASAIDNKDISCLKVYALEDDSVILDGVVKTIKKGKLNVFTGFKTIYFAKEGDKNKNGQYVTYLKLSGRCIAAGLGFLYNANTIDLSEAYLECDTAYLLESCKKNKSLVLNCEHTSSIGKLCYNNTSLEEINLSGYHAHDFRDMWYIFAYTKLKTLDLTGFKFDREKTEYTNHTKWETIENLYLPDEYFSLDTEIFDFSDMVLWQGESLDYSLITHLYDRVANELPVATIKLADKAHYQLTYNNLMEKVTSKGYTVTK